MFVEYLAPGRQEDHVAGLFHPEVAVELWIPDICVLEVANALRRRYLTDRRFTRKHLSGAVHDLIALGPIPVGSGVLVAHALRLADRLTVYDAAYVALAALRAMALCTLDAGLADAASDEGIQVLVPGTDPFEAWLRNTPRRESRP